MEREKRIIENITPRKKITEKERRRGIMTLRKNMDPGGSGHVLFRVLLRRVLFQLMFDSSMKRSLHSIDMYSFVIGIRWNRLFCHCAYHFYRDCCSLYLFHKLQFELLVMLVLQSEAFSILVRRVRQDRHPRMLIECKYASAHKYRVRDRREHTECPWRK